MDRDPPKTLSSVKVPSDSHLIAVDTQQLHETTQLSIKRNDEKRSHSARNTFGRDINSSEKEKEEDKRTSNGEDNNGRRGSDAPREYYVQVVTGLKHAMDPNERRRKEFGGLNGLASRAVKVERNNAKTSNDADAAAASPDKLSFLDAEILGPTTQFRLKSLGGSRTQRRQQYAYNPSNEWVLALGFNAYVQWTYKVTLWKVLGSLVGFFVASVTFFSTVIYLIGIVQPECLYVGSLTFNESGSYFIDAFQISWTTFSTVGYGLTGPNLSNDSICFGISLLTAAEAFVGVLYGGVAGAILMGKIMRYNAIAPIRWSDPLILRYGSGVKIERQRNNSEKNAENAETSETSENGNKNCDDEPIPYPIIEFRMGNEAFSRDGGEIANAKVQVWASILEKHASLQLRNAANKQKRRGAAGQHQHRNKNHPSTNLLDNADSDTSRIQDIAGSLLGLHSGHRHHYLESDDELKNRKKANAARFSKKEREQSLAQLPELHPTSAGSGSASVETDAMLRSESRMSNPFDHSRTSTHDQEENRPTCVRMDEGRLCSPTIYSRVNLENDAHPFFTRVWTLRHKLDKNSPLLDRDAISIIQRFHSDGGVGLPPELNGFDQLRRHVKFEEISVTMSGTDHITGNNVYGHTSYTRMDLVVGYRFANTLIRNSKTNGIGVDLSLLNDVLEQSGGGGEPLFEEAEFTAPLSIVDVANDIENQMTDLDGDDLAFDRL